MGLFNKILDTAKEGMKLADQPIVDKDALIQVKAKLAELEHAADIAAYEGYSRELSAPKDFRTMQRPLWSFICACGFALECVSFVVSYAMRFIPNTTITIEPLVYPMPINAIIMAVVMFYFGGRMFDKNNNNKFFEKWGI